VRGTTGFIRLFIRGLAWDAESAGATFADTLKAAARARLTDTSKGKVLLGTGTGGTSVTYTLPPIGDMTGQDLADVCSRLLDKCDQLLAANPALTDQLLPVMLLGEFPEAARSMRPDFSTFSRT
jgi:hypothetical protein